MAVLWGRHHVKYGHVETDAPADGVALAMSRGLHPKAYRWVDPNEDVVAAVVGPRATLLVVADGHNGLVAPEVAMRTVLDAFGDDPQPEPDDDELVALFHKASVAVFSATRELTDMVRRESRTTLSLAVVSHRRLCWAALGDSSVLVAEADYGMELTHGENAFLGTPMALARVDKVLQRGRGTLGDDAWVAVASDGFANFRLAPSTAAAAAAVLGDAKDATHAARGLIEHAFTGGAGDNVAVGVVAPPQT
jgi:serine/threonine protein phosphatase PrpC